MDGHMDEKTERSAQEQIDRAQDAFQILERRLERLLKLANENEEFAAIASLQQVIGHVRIAHGLSVAGVETYKASLSVRSGST